jgi:glutamate synthase (NADPH/NADH) small chain
MDCGIPFCQTGCPINNIIPDWNDLFFAATTGRHSAPAQHQQLPRVHRPHLPGALRGSLHAEHQQRRGGHQVDRALHHRQGLGRRLDCTAGGQPRPARRSLSSAPARPGSQQHSSSRVGHAVTVFEKSSRIGGLLRYGIPDFKMEKSHIDRRVAQMQDEGGVPDRVMITDAKLPVGWATMPPRRSRRLHCKPNLTPWFSPAARSTRVICRCLAASFPACTTQWNSCRYRTR